MPSRVACLQCHELPWAPSKEAGVGVGKSWHPPPCSYSEEAGATSALEGRPPGCTRPWLEENAHSRAATGWCRMVQPTPPMSQLGLSCNHHVQPPELYCRNLAAHTTPVPWCVIEGLRLLLLQKAGALPPPACHPLNQGPSWGTSIVTLVQGKLSYLTVGSTKPGQRDTLQKGGWSYMPQGPPKEVAAEGCRQGVIGRPAGRAGQGWTGARACHSADYASGLTFIPIHDLPRREGGELHWEAGLTCLETPEPHQHSRSKRDIQQWCTAHFPTPP